MGQASGSETGLGNLASGFVRYIFAAGASAGHADSPTRDPRRVQLPAGGGDLRRRPSGQSGAPDVGPLRDVPGGPRAHLHVHVPADARLIPGGRAEAIRPSLVWSRAEHGADVRGYLLDATGLVAAGVGAGGWSTCSSAPGCFQLLDEQLLGRRAGGAGRSTLAGRSAASVPAAARWHGPDSGGRPGGTGQQPSFRRALDRASGWRRASLLDGQKSPLHQDGTGDAGGGAYCVRTAVDGGRHGVLQLARIR